MNLNIMKNQRKVAAFVIPILLSQMVIVYYLATNID